MNEISIYMSKIGQKGGKARLKTMSASERSKSGKKAARSRWRDRKKKRKTK